MEKPPDGEPPRMENPPDGEPPPWRTPLGWRTPQDGEPPGMENPPRDGEPPPPEADSSIRSMSGRYASYWNAFLFQGLCFVRLLSQTPPQRA